VHGHHDVKVPGYTPKPNESLLVKRNLITPSFLETVGIPVLRGRDFTEQDGEDAESVMIVNETHGPAILAERRPHRPDDRG